MVFFNIFGNLLNKGITCKNPVSAVAFGPVRHIREA